MQKSDIKRLLFQGQDPLTYTRAAMKLLIAGFLGVVTGWVMQPFFTTTLGIPYWMAYWPAVIVGFVVNLRTQVIMKNIRMEKKPE